MTPTSLILDDEKCHSLHCLFRLNALDLLHLSDANKRLVATVQFCHSAPLINELECISFLVPSFGPAMEARHHKAELEKAV